MRVVTIEVSQLRDLIRDAVTEALRGSPMAKAMITASEADRLFRLQKGTAAAAFRAGMVQGEERPGRSRTGRVIHIRTADAHRAWGGCVATDLGAA